MKKLFISYAREDRERVEPLVTLLREEGFDVFWDTTMPSGVEWPEFLDAQLGSAQALLVLWTPDAVTSRWVRAEAHEALQQGKLVPINLDDVRPPFAFRQIHAFDLIGWRGDLADERLPRLVAELHARPAAGLTPAREVSVGSEVLPATAPPAEQPGLPRPPTKPAATAPGQTGQSGRHWLMTGAAALVLAVLGFWTWPWFAVAPAPGGPSRPASAVYGPLPAPAAPAPALVSAPTSAPSSLAPSSSATAPASSSSVSSAAAAASRTAATAAPPPKPGPAKSKPRCDAINEQLEMGLPVPDADRAFLKSGCR